MNEQELGKAVTRLLDYGLDDLDQGTLEQLKAVRMKALENISQTIPVIASGDVGAGVAPALQGGGDDDSWNYSTRKLLSLVFLLIALIGVFYWQTTRFDTDEDEVDMMLLVDDLPVDAYLDDEIDTWLNHS
jgi:Protein of unknown function (DUF3619)